MTFRVVGASTTKSRGIRNGEIYEMREAEECDKNGNSTSPKMAGCLIENVFLTFSSGSQKSTLISSSIDFNQREVTEADIGHALSKLNLFYDDLKREITRFTQLILALMISMGMDLRGISGSKLSADVNIVSINQIL